MKNLPRVGAADCVPPGSELGTERWWGRERGEREVEGEKVLDTIDGVITVKTQVGISPKKIILYESQKVESKCGSFKAFGLGFVGGICCWLVNKGSGQSDGNATKAPYVTSNEAFATKQDPSG